MLDISYETFVADQIPIEMAEQSQLFQDAFQELKIWLQQEFSGPIRTAIYGGAYTGSMAYHYLKKNYQVQLDYVFNRERPAKQLSDIQHIDLETLVDKKVINLDIVVVTTSPRHYADVIKNIEEKIKTKYILVLFREDEKEGRLITLPLNFINGLNRYRKKFTINIDRCALILIDIWATQGQKECPYCKRLPQLLKSARQNDMLIIHSAYHDLGENNAYMQAPWFRELRSHLASKLSK